MAYIIQFCQQQFYDFMIISFTGGQMQRRVFVLVFFRRIGPFLQQIRSDFSLTLQGNQLAAEKNKEIV